MSNNKIMQFSYFYWNTNEKKGDEKTTLFHDGSAMTAILRNASGKMHHGILFAPPLTSPHMFSLFTHVMKPVRDTNSEPEFLWFDKPR